MTCYMACVKPVSVRVEWGLLELNGQPRKIPFNNAVMCSDCYRKLKASCAKFVDAGKMHWSIAVVEPETASK